MKHPDVTSAPRGALRPVGRNPRRATLVLYDPAGSGLLVTRSCRIVDQVLARAFGASLDRQLAGGRAPESSRLLAARAQRIVSLGHRRALAQNWAHLLEMAGRGPAPGPSRTPICHRRIAAAEADVHELVTQLLVPLPVAARGVAAASVLLTDATGPLYNRRSCAALDGLVRTAMAHLDPSTALHRPAAVSPAH